MADRKQEYARVLTGKVTICRLGYSGDEYTMHIMTGTARTPVKWEEAGWTPPAPQLPSLEIVFDAPVEGFIQNVMAQHYIISYGDNRSRLEALCAILGIQSIG